MAGRQKRSIQELREVFQEAHTQNQQLVELWCISGGPNDVARRVRIVLEAACRAYPPHGRLPEQFTELESKQRLAFVLQAMSDDVERRKLEGVIYRKG